MKIGLRGGHSPNCKGAMGILDEQVEVRKIYNEMVPMLKAAGHSVVDCNSNGRTQGAELAEGTNKANSSRCDVYITIHMNASTGSGNGTECWLYNSGNGTMNSMADKIMSNFAAKGFYNRGKKYSTSYHDLKKSNMPAMIVETLFCDNSGDAQLYRKIGAKGIAEIIVKAIDGKAVAGATGSTAAPAPAPSKPPKGDSWVSRLQTECNAQGFSRQAVDGIAGKNTLAGCPQLGRTSRGNITALLQERLNALGYNCGAVDGINGSKTQAAIKAYQRAHGLVADGIVGVKTWSKLLGLS